MIFGFTYCHYNTGFNCMVMLVVTGPVNYSWDVFLFINVCLINIDSLLESIAAEKLSWTDEMLLVLKQSTGNFDKVWIQMMYIFYFLLVNYKRKQFCHCKLMIYMYIVCVSLFLINFTDCCIQYYVLWQIVFIELF